MNQYVISYLGGDRPATAEEGQAQFAKYREWLASLGNAAVKPMVPFNNTYTVHPNGAVTMGSSVAMTGHTVVRAKRIEDALEMAKSCPFLKINGKLDVAEMVQM